MPPPDRSWKRAPVRAAHFIRTHGLKQFIRALIYLAFDHSRSLSYARWVSRYDALSEKGRQVLRDDSAKWNSQPSFSILMPLPVLRSDEFVRALQSLRGQLYSNWELCLAIHESVVKDVKAMLSQELGQDCSVRLAASTEVKSNGWNQTLAIASGQYVALMSANAQLSEDALYWVARETIRDPNLDLLFTDEDKIDRRGERFDPWLKQAWNQSLMLSHNAFANFGVFRRALVEKVGGFRSEFDGSQHYDLVLRCANEIAPVHIRHIPRILYHEIG